MDDSNLPPDAPQEDGPGDEANISASERAKAELQATEARFERELAEIHQRAERGRASLRKAMPQPVDPDGGDATGLSGLAIGMSVATAIVGAPAGFFAIGWLIDRAVGGRTFQTWLTLIGAVLGVIYALLVLQRHNKDA